MDIYGETAMFFLGASARLRRPDRAIRGSGPGTPRRGCFAPLLSLALRAVAASYPSYPIALSQIKPTSRAEAFFRSRDRGAQGRNDAPRVSRSGHTGGPPLTDRRFLTHNKTCVKYRLFLTAIPAMTTRLP
jgi:hypothetical protein